MALGVLMLATVMQLLCRPFREPAMNDLERLSLYSTCSTLYLSLFLYVEGVSEVRGGGGEEVVGRGGGVRRGGR